MEEKSNLRLNKLKEMLAQKPGDVFVQFAIALEYAGMKDPASAVKHFEELLAQSPDYLATYYQLGKQYELQGEIDKAIDTYQKGIAVASAANDQKTQSELQEALMQWSDE